MQISVSGHHVQITEAIEQYIRKKLRRLEKHYQPIINSQVILTVDKNVQKAETRIHISGAEVFAEAESNNLYTSIDKMVKKLDRKMIEMKRKLVTKRHQTATILAE
ncbi:MAG: ribosome-associated translation inhibitor RaiA [Gammaproteobacteria bacterium]|jgi:putative sigma-54 modulation protein|nr:ribosome-associated translation inhibitor RaiA [Gammaproteobacteria bacterium]